MISKQYPSKSSPDTIYTAQVNNNGLLSCNCRGWVNKREGKPRMCAHTRDLADEYGLELVERDGQMFVTNATEPQPRRHSDLALPPKTLLAPMLASAMPGGFTADDFNPRTHVMEEKFDGHRILTQVGASSGEVFAWSRGAKPRTLPAHIHDLVDQLPEGIYDGELIVPGGHSYDVTAGQNSGSECLVLFDILESRGTSTRSFTYDERRSLLAVAQKGIPAPERHRFVMVAEQYTPSMAMVRRIWKRKGEGAILKRRDSLYYLGARTDDWIKVKASASAVFTIIGYETGKVGTYSAVRVLDPQGIETTVKTLDNATMRAMIANPNSFIGRHLVISYQERTPSGKYRHPMWDHLLDK